MRRVRISRPRSAGLAAPLRSRRVTRRHIEYRMLLVALGLLTLGTIGGLALSGIGTAAPLDDINQYADRCAAEFGAGAGAYMPVEILPDPTSPDPYAGTREIPVYWNQKRITYEAPDATRPEVGEYKFAGVSGRKAGDPGGVYPDGANTVGKIVRKQDLKCDFWSHVNTANGCVPGQRILHKDVGTCMTGDKVGQACSNDEGCPRGGAGACQDIVTWAFIFRRVQPPVQGAAFGPFHPYSFNNMDAIAFKKDTGATCWFDTIQVEPDPANPGRFRGKFSTTKNKWWLPATWAGGADTTGVPDGIPRPGGKDKVKQRVAAAFWNHPEALKDPTEADGATIDPGERCIACHGNGPVLVSRWINQGSPDPETGNPFGRTDGLGGRAETPYWHPAKLLPNPVFKQFDDKTNPKNNRRCQECHNYWSVSAATIPGGSLAEAMTKSPATEPVACNVVGVTPTPVTPACPLASAYRLEAGFNQDAGVLLEMPHKLDQRSPAEWDRDVKPHYEAMKVCRRLCEISPTDRVCTKATEAVDCLPGDECIDGVCGEPPRRDRLCAMNRDCGPGVKCLDVSETRYCAGGAREGFLCRMNADCPGGNCPAVDASKCEGAKQAAIPTFVGAEGANAPPNIQRVAPPRPAVSFDVVRTNCVSAPDGSETCDYRVSWQDPIPKNDPADPIARFNDYYAPDVYYLELNEVANQPDRIPQTKRFCAGTATPVNATTAPVPGSNWAKKYEVPDKLPACRKLEVRLCGSYKADSAAGANDFHSPVRTNDEGQVKTLTTACAAVCPQNGLRAADPRTTSASIAACPPVVSGISLTGSASRVGQVAAPGKETGAKVGMVEKFTLSGFVDLGASTLTIQSLLDEPGGASELVNGLGGVDLLPLTLAALPGGKPNYAIFETPSGALPKVRVEMQTKGQNIYDWLLRLERTTIPAFPQRCTGGSRPTTSLATSFTIDDGVNPPVEVSTVKPWRCLDLIGGDPQKPRSLRTP